jgi:signal transduction histidine kinase
MRLPLRLALIYTLVTTVVLVVIGVTVHALVRNTLYEGLRDQLEERSSAILAALQPGDPLTQTRFGAIAGSGVYAMIELRPQGDIVLPGALPFRTPNLTGNPYAGVELMDLLDPGETGPVIQWRELQPVEEGWVATPVLARAQRLRGVLRFGDPTAFPFIPEFFYPGEYVLTVAVSTAPVEETLAILRRVIFLVSAVAVAGVAVLGVMTSNRALAPLAALTRAAGRVRADDLGIRMPVPPAQDEVAALAHSMNEMLDRLQRSFEAQRRFTADASHELRSPLTAITGHVSYLIRRTQLSEEQRESLRAIRTETERLGRLVTDLLELARTDAGFPIDRAPLDLRDLIEDVHKDAAVTLPTTSVTAETPETPVAVVGDRARLKQVLANLIQNAAKAGATSVRLTLAAGAENVVLEVTDDGEGIPDEALPRVFDRFYRVDGARSRDGGGSGLGLAIVKAIVEGHGGRVEVTSQKGEGTTFRVRLPRSQAGA